MCLICTLQSLTEYRAAVMSAVIHLVILLCVGILAPTTMNECGVKTNVRNLKIILTNRCVALKKVM